MAKGEFDKLRLLVVDDSMISRQMILLQLKELGLVDCQEAANGKEALEKLRIAHSRDLQIDLVLCDWVMPEMTGIELLNVCRQETRFSNLPFIMITAEGGRKQIFEALISGHTDYIVKPLSAKMLESKVRKMVKKINQHRSPNVT